MARTQVFDRYHDEYENWFETHHAVYISEIVALRRMVPARGKGVEIGIGTGRFALPLGIWEGVEPSREMRRLASLRGLKVHDAVAEALPFRNGSFDFALMVTTVCFLDDVMKAFREVRRILVPHGCFVVGLVDGDSPLGRRYRAMKSVSPFYRIATMYSADEVIGFLLKTGFKEVETVQTIFGDLEDIQQAQTSLRGYGEGGFVAIGAMKTEQ
jgi:SAM-dependent methyltransferase